MIKYLSLILICFMPAVYIWKLCFHQDAQKFQSDSTTKSTENASKRKKHSSNSH